MLRIFPGEAVCISGESSGRVAKKPNWQNRQIHERSGQRHGRTVERTRIFGGGSTLSGAQCCAEAAGQAGSLGWIWGWVRQFGQAAASVGAQTWCGGANGVVDLAADLGCGLARGCGRSDGAGGGGVLLLRPVAAGGRSAGCAGAGVGDAVGPRWSGFCLAGRDIRRADHGGHGVARSSERGDRHRGQAVLSAFRRLAARHRQRGDDQPVRRSWPVGGQWRVHHHATGGKAAVSGRALCRQRVEIRRRLRGGLPVGRDLAQGQGNPLCHRDGGQVFQGRYPDDLFQPGLSGCRGARV